MSYVVTSGVLPDIDFAPATELEEILQNVRCIICTPKYSVPLDREFGVNMDYVDAPMNMAKAKMAKEIVMAVAKYEPRAAVSGITWGATEDGQLQANVEVTLNE